MRILVAGDIVGSPGRAVFSRIATVMKQRGEVDFVVANGENAAAGRGITPKLAEELFNAGADAMTLGDHTWDQKDIPSYLDQDRRIIRPANFTSVCPGRGYTKVQSSCGPILLINLIGRVFMQPQECPFLEADRILEKHPDRKITLVDFHAEATSEKIAMGRYLDGRVTAVWGTHTHVQTADETILPKGTGYITDLGMTGPTLSVLGREYDAVIRKFVTGLPTPFGICKKHDPELQGILLDVNEKTGKLKKIERVRKRDP
ncbi:MAG: TIGR00282 family metallophosphoesterase [Verrucomicrobiota bacterium]